MKLKSRQNFSFSSRRAELARFISNTIEGEEYKDVPYTTNEGDDSYWKLDIANNWGLKFYEEDPHAFSIHYRYQNDSNKAQETLGAWLKFRLYLEEVE
jgi:hypothetical protein